jgi:hypothetical protein
LHQQQLKEFKHDVVQAVSATEDQSHQAITKAIQVHCRLRAHPQATTSAKEKDLKPEGLRSFRQARYATHDSARRLNCSNES